MYSLDIKGFQSVVSWTYGLGSVLDYPINSVSLMKTFKSFEPQFSSSLKWYIFHKLVIKNQLK